MKRTGFTLIEVLIVFGILSLLLAILLPVFARVREKARQTRCLSNLRQLGVASAQYVQDNDSRFFPLGVRAVGTGAGFIEWDGLLPPDKPMDPLRGLLGVYLKSSAVFFCPSAEGAYYPSYGPNECLGDSSGGRNPLRSPQPMSAVDAPADTVLFADYTAPGLTKLLHPPSDPHEHWEVQGRHNGNAGVAFIDGHVRFLKPVTRDHGHMAPLELQRLREAHDGTLLRGPYKGVAIEGDFYYGLRKSEHS